MGTTTPNYAFYKPGDRESGYTSALNANWDTLDAAIPVTTPVYHTEDFAGDVQDTIDAAEAAGSGIVQLPAGEVDYGSLVITNDGVILQGAGPGSGGTKLHGSSSSSVIRVSGYYCALRDFRLDGHAVVNDGILLHDAGGGSMTNVFVTGTEHAGILFDNDPAGQSHGNNNGFSFYQSTAQLNNGVGLLVDEYQVDNNAINLFNFASNQNGGHGVLFRGYGWNFWGGQFEGNTGYGVQIGVSGVDATFSQNCNLHFPWMEGNTSGYGVNFSYAVRCTYYKQEIGGMQELDPAGRIENTQWAWVDGGYFEIMRGNGDKTQMLFREYVDTTSQLRAQGGITTKVKAGTPTDSDTLLDADGTIIGDSSGSKIWIRLGGTWKSVVVS